MGSIEWDPSLETGDVLVDEQHRNIHSLFNYLESAEDKISEIMHVLERLMEHVDCHFATEEELMERASYPHELRDEHIREHRELTDAAREIVLEFRRGEIASTAQVVEFLRAWLSEHVHERDRALVACVRARGDVARLPERWASNPPQLNGSAA